MQIRQPQLKAILATGYAELPRDIALDIPRLTKPFTFDQLDAIVR